MPEIPVIIGLAVSTVIIIILNATEVYEKVLIINTAKLGECKTIFNKYMLFLQIAQSALIMYISIILMMAQKDPIS
jgi:hypothetical protein